MTFEADLHIALADMTTARAELISAIQSLSADDLERARRGGWPIVRVIEHVIESDYMYAVAATVIREQQVPPRGEMSCAGQPTDEIVCRMESARGALLTSVKDVTEDQFYRLEKLGHEEYSILSVLENAAAHDREHTGQIRSILSTG
jgi:uncharacterized damage-inducible protein DinB